MNSKKRHQRPEHAGTTVSSVPPTRIRALLKRGEFKPAESLCRQRLAVAPADAEVLGLLGIIAVKTRRPDLALQLLPEAIKRRPLDPEILTYHAAALLMSRRLRQAMTAIRRSRRLQPDDALSLNIEAVLLGMQGRHKESLRRCERALQLDPGFAEAWLSRGIALIGMGRAMDALHSFERARKLKQDFMEAISNSANVLRQLGRREEALERYAEALRINPAFADAAYNRGVTFSELARPREAARSFALALKVQPDFAGARYNLAHCQLQLGDFRRGWANYAVQWQRTQPAWCAATAAQPLRPGKQSLRGQRVLLYADAGLGDTLQFCRYASRIKALGATVLLEVQAPLRRLLTGLHGVDRLIVKGSRLPAFDRYCPLMQLPEIFGDTIATVPSAVPYLRSDPALAARWRRRLGAAKPGQARIGLVWSGNAAHANDHNRSLALPEMAPLLQNGVDWISLQKEIRVTDAELIPALGSLRHFGPQLRDFADTAALIEQLDLVISVDTSVAHLAGAMGKPVCLLLPFNPDWRWMLRRRDSTWYPTLRLFRQPAIGDWGGVIKTLHRTLKRDGFV